MISLRRHICVTWPEWVNELMITLVTNASPGLNELNLKRFFLFIISNITHPFLTQVKIPTKYTNLTLMADTKCKYMYLHLFRYLNSLAPWRSGCDSKNGIFNLVSLIGIFRSYDNALRWMPQDLNDDKSTLVQVMAWCHQATSHYLSQCWLSSLSPYGVTRPQ